jgi:hypothetical protein
MTGAMRCHFNVLPTGTMFSPPDNAVGIKGESERGCYGRGHSCKGFILASVFACRMRGLCSRLGIRAELDMSCEPRHRASTLPAESVRRHCSGLGSKLVEREEVVQPWRSDVS